MAPNFLEIAGEIRVTLGDDAGRITAVTIASSRPIQAARVFEGKPVAEMTETIGRVFSLCGTAQTVAALTAAEVALGVPADAGVAAARRAARHAEMMTQLTTRLALHWPRVLELPLAPGAVRAALAAERAIETGLLGAGWRRPGGAVAGAAEATMAAEIDVAALVAPLARALRSRGLESYGALPAGVAPEAGVLARQWQAAPVARARADHGAGLAARLAAAETALGALPAEIAADLAAARPAAARTAGRDSGTGAATVETARGPLTHRLSIEAGLVTRCRTEAPTEPNFAADGPVAAGLIGEKLDPVAAELHLLAIDPCVACRLELAPG